MANEIEMAYTTGQSLYAAVMNGAGQLWNGGAFETPTTADWGMYAVALSEVGSGTGLYAGSFPAAIAAPGSYRVFVYAKGGSSAVSTDGLVGSGQIAWTGSAEGTIVAGYATGQDPATLLKADGRFSKLLSYVDGKYTYNPATGVLTFYAPDGATVLFRADLTFDDAGNIVERDVA